MNRVSLKVSPGSDVQALLQELAKLGPTLMFDLGPKLVSMSVKTARDFLEGAGELITAALPKIELPGPSKPCCQIPETECPPRCVCDVHWKSCPGGTVQAHVKVINIGSATRNFTFIATPFSGPGNPKATIQISPASASLAPHASVDVIASFTAAGEKLLAKGAEVLIPAGGEVGVFIVEAGLFELHDAPVVSGVMELVKMGEMAVRLHALTGRFTSKRLTYSAPAGDFLTRIREHYGPDVYPAPKS